MKVVILAGGQQSTISSIGENIPKPMVEIGGRPLLWHIMKHFSKYGLKEFIVCGGYRIDKIKEYFMDFYIYESDITVDLEQNTIEIHKKKTEDWKVTVVNTGLHATPGQRILAVADYLLEKGKSGGGDDSFLVTYGDCLSDVDASALINVHKENNKLVTLVMAKPQGRKQLLTIDEQNLLHYDALSPIVAEAAWVNADCFIMNEKVLEYLQGNCNLEEQVFRALSKLGQVATYRHEGYWTTLETKRDLAEAEKLWNDRQATWIRGRNNMGREDKPIDDMDRGAESPENKAGAI